MCVSPALEIGNSSGLDVEHSRHVHRCVCSVRLLVHIHEQVHPHGGVVRGHAVYWSHVDDFLHVRSGFIRFVISSSLITRQTAASTDSRGWSV